MPRRLTIRCTGHRLGYYEPGIDLDSVVSFSNPLLLSTAGGAGELRIR